MLWAVSQAAPLRRVHVTNDLVLHGVCVCVYATDKPVYTPPHLIYTHTQIRSIWPRVDFWPMC